MLDEHVAANEQLTNPIFQRFFAPILVPKLLDEFINHLWSAYFGKTSLGIVIHGLGLFQRHFNPFRFATNAPIAFPVPLMLDVVIVIVDTALNVFVVPFLGLVAQWIDRHANVLGGNGNGRIDIVGQVRVVGRNVGVVNGIGLLAAE
jgi:hypothetical protein